jgi:phosphoserine aminotransferase
MDYKVHISNGSMFNTPPVFSVYVCMLTMEWLKKLGGVKAIEEINEMKARVLYSEIDLNPLFKGYAVKEDRSNMNATFTLVNDNLKETFETMLKDAGISGLAGHRSVGGYRASMYNALSLDSVKALVEVMSELETKA